VGLELRNPVKRDEDVKKGLEIGKYFQSLGATYLIAADSGDPPLRTANDHIWRIGMAFSTLLTKSDPIDE
jgi:hypothetical protein